MEAPEDFIDPSSYIASMHGCASEGSNFPEELSKLTTDSRAEIAEVADLRRRRRLAFERAEVHRRESLVLLVEALPLFRFLLRLAYVGGQQNSSTAQITRTRFAIEAYLGAEGELSGDER